MPIAHANGIPIHYEDHGNPADPVVLLIMGFGAQLTLWPDELVEAIAREGYRVIRYDNRDIGLSHKFDGVRAPGAVKLTLMNRIGLRPRVPYTLGDMADDGAGLLDALGIASAHIAGASMGGMIAQRFAARHPGRTRSLISIFSTTGNPKLPPARKEAMQALLTRPQSNDEAVLVEHGMMLARTIGSPGFPADEERLRANITAAVRRSVYPEGPTRHLAAILADGDRRKLLRTLDVPTLVLHGEDDPLIPVAAGHDTAAHIRGARLRTIAGWGHDLPLALVDELAGEIAGHAKAAS
ncbi:MAG: alpha/beta fold hydrolase [Erythrobacter sp.]